MNKTVVILNNNQKRSRKMKNILLLEAEINQNKIRIK